MSKTAMAALLWWACLAAQAAPLNSAPSPKGFPVPPPRYGLGGDSGPASPPSTR